MIDNKLTDNEIMRTLELFKSGKDENFAFVSGNALDLINRKNAETERLQELVDEMGDYFPACINCEGKTTIGERTDACVYLIDTTNYCTKRGMRNIVAIQNENRELKAEIKTAKSEAVKEFAERLIQEDGYNNHTFDDCASILVPAEYRKGREEKIKEVWELIERIKKEVVGESSVAQ